jgi:hypothetical protein
MKFFVSALTAAAIVAAAAPAFASTTAVSCENYVVAINDDIAIQGQVLAGSDTAFRTAVCELTAQHSALENPAQVPIYSPGLNLTTRVMIIPTNVNDN